MNIYKFNEEYNPKIQQTNTIFMKERNNTNSWFKKVNMNKKKFKLKNYKNIIIY